MNEKTFKKYNEMARNTGYGSYNAHSGKKDWEFELSKNNKELLKDKLGSERYKVYKVFSKYYLTSENDEYLGRLELTPPNNKGVSVIETSHSNIKKGFYNIMFTAILGSKKTGIKEILSDTALSNQAIKSYTKLSKLNNLKLSIYDTFSGKQEYDEKTLLDNENYRVSITENWNLEKVFEDYYNRITNGNRKREYFERCSSLDNFLFSENWED